jgi:hypothetical protein
MEFSPQDRLLHAAQDNLLKWRFRLTDAVLHRDLAAFRSAMEHHDFWRKQVARLVERENI